MQICNNMLQILEFLINDIKYNQNTLWDLENSVLPMVFFSIIWGVGGLVDEKQRHSFATLFIQFLQPSRMIRIENLIEETLSKVNREIKIKKVDLGIKIIAEMETNKLEKGLSEPELFRKSEEEFKVEERLKQVILIKLNLQEKNSIFDYMLQTQNLEWKLWKELRASWSIFDHLSLNYEEIIVPTIDTTRNEYFAQHILGINRNFLLTGPTGTAKTVGIQSMIEKFFSNSKKGNLVTNFSGQTTANSVQAFIEQKMTTRKGKKGYFGPENNKELMLVFIDDVNMPAKEECGAQGPVELLRMWLDHQFWYDLDTMENKFLVNMQMVCTMGPPSSGRNSVTGRFLGHFFTLYVTPFGKECLQTIFESLLNWHFKRTSFPVDSSISELRKLVVKGTIDLYDSIKTCKELRPTPKKSHYFYNLRDLSKVIQIMTRVDGRSLSDGKQFLKLWAHECNRVFMDRLISQKDRQIFRALQEKILYSNFGFEWKELTGDKNLIWGDFLPLTVNIKEKSHVYKEVYHELEDWEQLYSSCQTFLEEYNNTNNEKMNLVLFADAIEHIARILRIIKTPNGHCLLVGTGGLGRQSLSCLSAFIACYETFSVEVGNDYSYAKDWPEDLQELMKICGFEDVPTVFILRDNQIFAEEVLEDISTILNKGAVASVFKNEDKARLIENISLNFPEETSHLSTAEKFEFFLNRCRKNLHLSLCFSPADKNFKVRLRTFPSLINCSSIDWFLDWPEEALLSVAETVIGDLLPDSVKLRMMSRVFVYMHEQSRKLAERYQQELRKFYYVTPTSYLELLRVFRKILQERTLRMAKDINRYEIGVEKLENSKRDVENMKVEILIMEPKLKKATIETEKLILEVKTEQLEVDTKKKICEKEEIECNRDKQEANDLKKSCKEELNEVEPILEEATKTLSKVQRPHIDFIKKIQKVRPPIEKLFHSLCVLLPPGEIPKKKDPKNPYKKIFDWATPARNIIMAKPDQMLLRLRQFDAVKINSLSPKMISQLKEIRKSNFFTLPALRKVSEAAEAIGKIVLAIIEIHDKLQIINPKREALRNAEFRLEQAEIDLSAKKQELFNLMEKFRALTDKLEKEKRRKEDLERKIARCKKQLGAAEQLVVGLETEKINWKMRLDNLKFNSKTLTGDAVMAAGIIAYLGVFPIQYREETILDWLEFLKTKKILVNSNFKLKNILSNELTIGVWLSQKLPNDDFSIENAIIMNNSQRFPLFVDPQAQALNWIRTMEGEALRVIKPTSSPLQLQNKIIESLEGGLPLLFENATENLDSYVINLLRNKRRKVGHTEQVQFQKRWVTVAPGFRFYITTKLMRPHYDPEVCVLVTMLNFQVTSEGLEDQLLNVLVSREEPNTEKARINNIKEFHELRRKQKETEDKILNLLFSKETDLLEDIILIETLKKSKEEAQDAKIRLKEIENMKTRLSHIRNFYKPVAFRAAHLFFCVVDLGSVGPMYQFSLEWFISLYRKSIDKEPKIKNSRVQDINNNFLSLLFSSVCSSLFERDKLLFAFLIFMKLQYTSGKTNLKELRILLVGPTKSIPIQPNPMKNLVSDKTFAALEEMVEQNEVFSEVVEHMTNFGSDWKEVLKKDDLHICDLRFECMNLLSTIQELILIRILRPDRVIVFIRRAIQQFLGKDFLEFPQTDLSKSFLVSSPKTPLIFILSPGSDPLTDIKRLGENLNKGINVKILSLGQGQETNANNFIQYAMKEGEWVVLQNCHLSYKYLSIIEKQLEINDPHEDFRLWLTSMPSDKFPVTVLQNGIKITNEPPQGLKANTLKNFNVLSPRIFESHPRSDTWKKLLYGLVLFHSVIQERRKFSSLGWNIPYEFSQNDLAISKTQLKTFLADYSEIPWQGLHTCIADLNYGGRVTDPMDSRLIKVILKNYLNVKVLDDEYKFSPCGNYKASSGNSLEDFKRIIKERFPLEDSPDIFGLHPNADIVVKIKLSGDLLASALKLLPRNSSETGSFNDHKMIQICEKILQRIPELFDIALIEKLYPTKYEDSMNTVLQQELMRYNILTKIIKETLKQVIRGVKGLIVMSTELEQILDEIFDNKVPLVWAKQAYPSKKALNSWIEDYLARILFIQNWVDLGHPSSYWISGFFFTQSFLTGTKQDYSRKHKIPIGSLYLFDDDFSNKS